MPDRSVLMVCRSARGGMKQHLFSLARGLSQNGIKVTIASPPSGPPAFSASSSSASLASSAAFTSFAVKNITLPIPENPLALGGINSIYKLARIIRENDYDLVHTHGYVAGIIGRIAAVKAGNRILVHTVHNSFPAFTPLVLYGGKKIEVFLSRYTGSIITVSEHLKKELITIGVPADKISTIYNGIDPPATNPGERHRIRNSLGLPPHSFAIGTVARLIPAKGVDLFIEALALVKKNNPGIKGIIVGDGPENLKLQNLAARLGMTGDILFLGHRSDVPELLSAFDLFILSSRQEGFGISVLEAQCSGLPVIASRAGGIPEIISHGNNGLLFPPGDYHALADRLSLLLNNADYRHTLASAGEKKARENYTCDKMIESTLELYGKLF